jgi:hypothetical protein
MKQQAMDFDEVTAALDSWQGREAVISIKFDSTEYTQPDHVPVVLADGCIGQRKSAVVDGTSVGVDYPVVDSGKRDGCRIALTLTLSPLSFVRAVRVAELPGLADAVLINLRGGLSVSISLIELPDS